MTFQANNRDILKFNISGDKACKAVKPSDYGFLQTKKTTKLLSHIKSHFGKVNSFLKGNCLRSEITIF